MAVVTTNRLVQTSAAPMISHYVVGSGWTASKVAVLNRLNSQEIKEIFQRSLSAEMAFALEQSLWQLAQSIAAIN